MRFTDSRANVAALLKTRTLQIATGPYLERADPREHPFEDFLRALVARVPRIPLHHARARRFIALTNSLEPELGTSTPGAVVTRLRDSCLKMRRHGFTDALLAQAFAAVREASLRTLGLRHYDVQLHGGWAMLQGTIAEMETGEGKTLVATLAACTAAMAGAAVHVITVNDYLAERDAAFNSPLYDFFGLRVGVIRQGMSATERQTQYERDIIYVSNKEIVFDYLKDRLATTGAVATHQQLRQIYRGAHQPKLLLRGLHVALVDEADSVLIDEARTPLIISETQPDEHGIEFYRVALQHAAHLLPHVHFILTPQRDLWLTAQGEQYANEITAHLEGVWRSALWRRELLEKALSALHCYQRDQHYIVTDGKIHIVDEFSGRVMPDRSWERGLHQMIEAKEDCAITGQRKTLAQMTYQRFFRRYLLLCGMTGTAAEVKTELRRVYDLNVMKIPTNKPSRRRTLGRCGWRASSARWQAVAERAINFSQQGRAVLIGTRSVEASEQLSVLLREQGIPHQVLNARQDQQEAQIVEQAGLPGRITVATNMAGRGTDIRLSPEVALQGGLHVILSEFHDTSRIDRQLFGRCARQGEPGTVEAMVSLEDALFTRHAPLLQRFFQRFGSPQLTPWQLSMLVFYAQRRAQHHHAGVRLRTLKQDRKLQALLAFSGKPE